MSDASTSASAADAGIGRLVDTETIRALVDIGFISLSRGLDRHAEAVFAGVAAARPEHETGPMGLALVSLLRGDPAAAAARLRKLPPTDPVQLFLGMSLIRLGDRSGGRAVLGRLIATAEDPGVVAMAEQLLAEG